MEDFFRKSIKTDVYLRNISPEELRGYREAVLDYKRYFIKSVWNYNEIVGELLAKKLKLSSAHYEPAISCEEYVMISPDFRYTDYKYRNLFEFDNGKRATVIFKNSLNNNLEEFMEYYKLTGEDYQNILKLIALDIFMRQRDRDSVNIMVCSNDDFNTVHLAPIFDYSDSFCNSFEGFSLDNPTEIFKKYRSAMENIRIHDTKEREQFPRKSLSDFISSHPDIVNYFKTLLDLDILELLNKRLDNYDIKLTDNGKWYYENNQNFSKEIIKKFI